MSYYSRPAVPSMSANFSAICLVRGVVQSRYGCTALSTTVSCSSSGRSHRYVSINCRVIVTQYNDRYSFRSTHAVPSSPHRYVFVIGAVTTVGPPCRATGPSRRDSDTIYYYYIWFYWSQICSAYANYRSTSRGSLVYVRSTPSSYVLRGI
jgi:hypothetical protein